MPLKSRNLVTCEPDVLNFKVSRGQGRHEVNPEGEPEFALLATDGLWDVMSNEEAVELARRNLAKLKQLARKPGGSKEEVEEDASGSSAGDRLVCVAKALAESAYDRDSMDNVTVIAVGFRNC